MLTGRRPREGDLPIAADHPQSLFTPALAQPSPVGGRADHRRLPGRPVRRAPAGHDGPPELARLRPAGRLGPPAAARRPRRRPAADRPRLAGLRGRRDRAAGESRAAAALHRGGVPADRRRRPAGELRADRARRSGEPGARPPLLFLHTSIPHVPWHYTPDGKRYETRRVDARRRSTGRGSGRSGSPTRASSATCCRPSTPTGCSAACCDRLRETGLYDRALIVVAGRPRRELPVRRPAAAADARPTSTTSPTCRCSSSSRARREGGDRGHRGAHDRRAADDRRRARPAAARAGRRRPGRTSATPTRQTEIDVPDSWELGTTTTTSGRSCASAAERRRYERSLLGPPATTRSSWARGRTWSAAARARRSPATARSSSRTRRQFEDVRPGLAAAADLGGRHRDRAARRQRGSRSSVNGRVEATTRVDRGRFAALVPPRRAAGRREPRRGLRDRRRHI